MAQDTDATVEVEHNGETIDVPLAFEIGDLAAWFGDVPDFEVDRVFVYEENLRVESYIGDETWVEAIYQTEDSAPVFNASELGWVAQLVTGSEDSPDIGETIWTRD